MKGLFLQAFHFLCLCLWQCQTFHLNFVTVLIGDNPLYGYYAAGPFFDIAFANVSKTYPHIFRNVSRTVFHKPRLEACGAAGDFMYSVTGEIYDTIRKGSGFTIILCPGCSLEIMALGDFAREINAPLMASTSADLVFANAKRYPTIVTFGPLGQGSHSTAAKTLVKKYAWRSVTLFCDAFSRYPSAASSLGITCRAFKSLFSTGEFNFYVEDFDSAINPDYEARLLRAGQQSRVIIILTRSDEVRKFMLTAYRLNMTSDEYVYINSKPCKGPEFTELKVDMSDGHDNEAFEAYKTLIAIEFVQPDYVKMAPLITEAANLAATKYNHTYAADERENEITLSIPEIMFAIGKILNDSQIPLDDVNTSYFRQQFLGQTFYTPVRRVRIGTNGMRMSDSVFTRLNKTSRRFEPTWYYDFPSKMLSVTNPVLANDWNGRGVPPPNEPLCGFRRDLCVDSRNDNKTIIIAGACSGIVLAIVVILTAVFARKTAYDQSDWWYLKPDLLREEKSDGLVTPRPGFPGTPYVYGSDQVWMRSEIVEITEQDLLARKTTRVVLAQIRNLRHETIGRFYGMLLLEKYTCVLWEYGRGSLRNLFTNDTVMSDGMFRKSLMFSILNGVQHIHHSPLHCHGSLSCASVIVDSRFSAKVCDVASVRIYRSLSRKLISLDEKTAFAPETAESSANFETPEADVYAVGVIIHEISNGAKLPGAEIKKNGDPVMYEKEINFTDTLHTLIEQCCSVKRESRPTIKNVLTRLAPYRPQVSIITSLLRRLEDHAENLEVIVMARTTDLLFESQKVDSLLAEIIPPSLIPQMRNKTIMPAEFFECATIFFSSMVGFDKFCVTADPLQVSTFLNDLYTFVDGKLSGHDVYKVETIKDGYVVASGLPIRNSSRHAQEIVSLALYILLEASREPKMKLPMRIGIHSGPIAAGIVGLTMPRYCLFGDTVNTASRMESHGEASKIQISNDTKTVLDHRGNSNFHTESRGQIQIKGKGLIETFWVMGYL